MVVDITVIYDLLKKYFVNVVGCNSGEDGLPSIHLEDL